MNAATLLPQQAEPLKWQKYLLLAEFGFVTHDHLSREIRRYRRVESAIMIRDIRHQLQVDRRENHKSLFVVKLVPSSLQGQLPNYRIESQVHLRGLRQFLREYVRYPYVEVWFCATRIDLQLFSVAGRIVFTRRDASQSQTVEQVWRCSPRLIEQYSGRLHCPYLRAARYDWGWRFDVEQIHIPRSVPIEVTELTAEFADSVKLLESHREKIEDFLTFLDGFDFGAYSLEYKIVGSSLEIIDWDTPDDKRVLWERCAFFA